MIYLLPLFIIFVPIYGAIKKVRVYDCFTKGAQKGVKLVFSVFPFIATILVMLELFKASGLDKALCGLIAPVLSPIGVPPELCELLILRPLSGNGSIAILQNLIDTYGADSHIVRSAGVIIGSSETVFYVTAIYYSQVRVKKLGVTVFASLTAAFTGALLSCLLCYIM